MDVLLGGTAHTQGSVMCGQKNCRMPEKYILPLWLSFPCFLDRKGAGSGPLHTAYTGAFWRTKREEKAECPPSLKTLYSSWGQRKKKMAVRCPYDNSMRKPRDFVPFCTLCEENRQEINKLCIDKNDEGIMEFFPDPPSVLTKQREKTGTLSKETNDHIDSAPTPPVFPRSPGEHAEKRKEAARFRTASSPLNIQIH